MKVLFATYPWAFETPGGGEIQLRKYAEHLPTHGVDVLLHDPWRPDLSEAQAVHFFSCIGGSVHFCAYVKQRGLPLVISSSLWITEATKHLYPIDEIRAQLALADVIVTNSQTESNQLARVLDLPHERFAAVMNGFEPRFAEANPKTFRDAYGLEGKFILNVGNIEPRKNQLGLVRALKDSKLPVVLIGHRRDEAYADQVMAEGSDVVRYLGNLDHHDPRLASAFAACSVFVLPSTLETPGLAALEAAASGAAVVVTSEGSTRDYFADHVGYANHADPADIRRATEAAIAKGSNPALKAHVLKQFRWNTVTAALPEIYKQAIRRNALT